MFEVTNTELFKAAQLRAQAHKQQLVQAKRDAVARREAQRWAWMHMSYTHLGGHRR